MSSIPRNSERDRSVHLDALHTLLCRSICALLVDFALLVLFNYEMATKPKFIFLQREEWQLNLNSIKMSIRVV